MEEQHPIPQQISAYQFRLVGDMTLKQFFQVAGGALVALLIYSSPLHPVIKWPGILISFLFGVALAFFPIEDRPLEKWIVAFFKSIYSPTIFVWQRGKEKRVYFQKEKAVGAPEAAGVTIPKIPVQEVAQVTKSEVRITPDAMELEQTEQEFLSKVSEQFGAPATAAAPTIITQVPSTGPGVAAPKPRQKARRKVYVPKTGSVYVEKAKAQATMAPEERMAQPTSPYLAPTPTVGRRAKGAVAAKFSQEAAPPSPPTMANIVVGQVMDAAGKIVDGAILEIKDEEGRAARALKTNKVGHFMIVTPLLNGKYELITEKEGLEFSAITFTAKGSIIPPIAIRAKGVAEDAEQEEGKVVN